MFLVFNRYITQITLNYYPPQALCVKNPSAAPQAHMTSRRDYHFYAALLLTHTEAQSTQRVAIGSPDGEPLEEGVLIITPYQRRQRNDAFFGVV